MNEENKGSFSDLELKVGELTAKLKSQELIISRLKQDLERQSEKNCVKEQLLRNSPSLLFATDIEGKILVGYGAEEELKFSSEEFLNKKVSELLDSNASKKIMKAIHQANESGKSRQEYSLMINNQERYYSIRTKKRDSVFFHVVNNITDRKKTIDALTKSEEQFKTLFQILPVSIMMHDKDTGEILDANPATLKAYEAKSLEELKENNFWLEPPYSFSDALKKIHKAKKEGVANFEWLNITKSGKLFWENVYLKTFEINGLERVLSSAIDITEIKKAQLKLEDNEQKLRAITNNVADVIFTMDLNLNTTFVSPSIEKMTGYSPEEYIKLSLEKKHPAEALRLIHEMYLEEIAKDKNPEIPRDRTRIIESQHHRKDGSLMDISIHTSFIRDKNGRPVGIQGVTRDITRLRRIEKEKQNTLDTLMHINQTQEKIFSVLGHDLRTPFNAIIGLSEILLQGYARFSEQERIDMLKKVHGASRNAYNLLEELLEWSMASKVEDSYQPQTLDLRETVAEIQRLYDSSISERRINFYNKIYPNTFIEADKIMFSSIVRNLLSNAIKYSNNEGTINVFSEEQNNHYRLIIEDEGVGIEEDKLKKLFFSEIESAKGTKGEQGSGLGLSLVKRFAEKHGGNIKIESEKGRGTKAYLTLPKSQTY